MKVNCILCGHTLDLRDAYDDYEGQVKCFVCGALLAIHTREGQVKSVELARSRGPASAPTLEKRPCETMGTGSGPLCEDLGKTASNEVPVPIFS